MDDSAPQKLSTSALAKSLAIATQQLFSTLKDYGWIRKLDEGWELTTKGEFEGGEYVHSKRFGRYIVWPQELSEHPLLQALEDNRHLSATVLAKTYNISVREVNRIFAELGWMRHGVQGWELTALGQRHGGVQLENDISGTFYVTWPLAVADHDVLTRELNYAADLQRATNTSNTDLFATSNHYDAIDGHQHTDKDHLKVCHWLYLAGIAHACHRRLPVLEELYADFYLPAHHLYIECWQDDTESGRLSQRMQRKTWYDKLELDVIDLTKVDMEQLDEVLTRQLRKYGVRVY